MTDSPTDGLRYADMLAELERILGELERDDVDVDVLAARVARAAELIDACRGRIDRARMEVERVVATLDDRPTVDDGIET